MVVTNPDGSKTTKTVEITVQRDTDRDGDPDVTDPDDDGDGVTDVEEKAKGSNPKDPNSRTSCSNYTSSANNNLESKPDSGGWKASSKCNNYTRKPNSYSNSG